MPKNPIIPFIGLFLLSALDSPAQSYQWAAGLKVSKYMGMSAVYSPAQHYSFEGVISKNLWTNESGFSLIGRYHRKVIVRSLNFYGGGGLHFGSYDNPELKNYVGLVLQGGAEVSLGKTNLSFNLTPMVGVGSEEVKIRVGSDVTIRYILKKQPRKKKNEFFEKLGINKKSKKEKEKERRKRKKKKHNQKKGAFWEFNWLKKEG